jgi:Ca2+-binding RTX toxin-like protein
MAATLHYAAGGSATAVTPAGFNLVDIQYASQANELPVGAKGLVWLNESSGVTSSFVDKVTPLIGNPKVFGFFLTDEPDPTGKYHTQVSAANLKAESDWIHSHFPGAKTFVTLMDMGSAANPNFSNTYNPANSHIDYYGLDPYPVRTGSSTVDYNMLDKSVAAAVASGIPASQIVPVYQTFGGGNWTTNTGGKYVMPTTAQLQTMMDHWDRLVPSPAFDFAYAWGSQQGDTAIENSSALQAFFRQHHLNETATPPASSGGGSSGGGGSGIPPKASADGHTLYGTNGADVFHGAGGHTMIGYGGNDTYYVDRTSEKTNEAAGGGTDKVLASVSYALSPGSAIELLAAGNASGTKAMTLTGDSFAQTVQGNAGNNVINGGLGADVLTGNAGHDAFSFNTALGAGNVDKITDFNRSQDTFHLDHTVFAGLKPGGLPSAAFFAGTAAHDSSDHIIYNSATGALSFDSDGAGGAAQTQFATLSPHLALTAHSFYVA